MNEIFNLKRFGLLLKEQISKNLKILIMGTVVVFAILGALNLISILSTSNHIVNDDTRFGFYISLMYPAGILLSGFWFTNIQKSSIESGGLLLPASHFEKICIAFLINVILFILIYIIIVVTLELAMFHDIKILKIILKHGLRYGSNLNDFYMPFLALQSMFLFGSLLFKKMPPLKTGFTLFLIYIGLMIVHTIVLKNVLKDDNYTNIRDFIFGQYNIQVSAYYSIIMKIVFYSSFPVFWVASYFKLKEKQV